MSSRRVEVEIDRSRCALCGGPNDCAMTGSGSESNEPCWCVGRDFPNDLVVIAADKDGGASCICRRCLESAAEN